MFLLQEVHFLIRRFFTVVLAAVVLFIAAAGPFDAVFILDTSKPARSASCFGGYVACCIQTGGVLRRDTIQKS